MAGKNIEIRFVATGAEAAANQVRTITPAINSATEATKQNTEAVTGFGGQLEAMERMAAAQRADAEAKRAAAEESRRLAQAETERLEEIEAAEARLQRQREADVEEARRRRDAREAEGEGEGGGNVFIPTGRGLGTAALQAAPYVASAAIIKQVAQESFIALQDLNAELERVTGNSDPTVDLLESLVEFAQNPIRGAVEALASGAKEELRALADSLETAKQTKAALEEMIETRRRLAQEASNRAFTLALQNEEQAIDNQTAALERQLAVLRARRDLASTQASIGEQERVAAGESPNLVAADRNVRQVAEGVAELDDGIQLAQQAVETARGNLDLANSRYAEISREFGTLSPEADAAFLATETAGNQLTQAVEELRAAEEIARVTAERIGAQGIAGVVQNISNAQAEVEAETAESVGNVLAKIESSRTQLSAVGQDAVARIQQVIADNAVTQNEIATLTGALQTLAASQNINLETLISIQRDGLAVVQSQTGQIQSLQTQLRDLQSQIQALSTR